MKYTITLPRTLTGYASKPTSTKDLEIISSSLNTGADSINSFEIDTATLLDAIGQGIPFVPSSFVDTRTSANFSKTNILCIDIDDKHQTPAQSIALLKNIGITANAYYYTYSYEPGKNHKHRIIVLFDDYVKDIATFKGIAKLLIKTVNADRSCSDPCRIFFATSSHDLVQHCTDTPNSLSALLESEDFHACLLTKMKSTRLSTIKTISTASGTNEYVESLLERIANFTTATNTSKIEALYEKLCNISLFDDFLIKNKKLKHADLFTVATTLRLLPRGKKLFKEKTKKHDYTQAELDLYDICTAYNYSPATIDEIGTNPIEYVLNSERYTVVNFKPYPYITLPVAQKRLRVHLRGALDDGKNLSIIDAETGLGKTQLLIDYIVDSKFNRQNGIAIAFPTHKLKEQFYNDIKAAVDGTSVTVDDLVSVTPDLPVFDDKDINKNISKMYVIHSAREVSAKLRNPETGLQFFTVKPVSQADIDKAKQYNTTLQLALKDTSKVLLTTHTRAVRDNMTHSTVIFDEDPFQAIEHAEEITYKEMSSLARSLRTVKSDYSKNLKVIVDHLIDHGQYVNQGTDINRDELVKTGIPSHQVNIADILLNAKVVVQDTSPNGKDIYRCSKPQHLRKNKKYVVMSATPTYYYYDNKYDCGKYYIERTKHQGTCVQRADRSYSRGYCQDKANAATVHKIMDKRDRAAITYKSMAHKSLCEDIYYGNTAGYNDLTGKDIAIVGTPHKPVSAYLLSALVAGYEVTHTDANACRMAVTHNDQSVVMMSFKSDVLRKIQMTEIEKEILQAHGRARTIRNKCNVDIYSNFPLPQYVSRDIKIDNKIIAEIA